MNFSFKRLNEFQKFQEFTETKVHKILFLLCVRTFTILFTYRNRKRRDIIIILKIVKFDFLILTDTVVTRQTADVTLGGILQL
jgi:hypothetical protein